MLACVMIVLTSAYGGHHTCIRSGAPRQEDFASRLPAGSTNTKHKTQIFCLPVGSTSFKEVGTFVYPDSTDSKQTSPLHPFIPSSLLLFSARRFHHLCHLSQCRFQSPLNPAWSQRQMLSGKIDSTFRLSCFLLAICKCAGMSYRHCASRSIRVSSIWLF
jgi:hypothetical protein